jgi:protein-S-isoprenylcysteine O-methyltransferase Ste14
MNDERDHAPIIAPPPLLIVLCIVAGFIARHFKRLPLLTEGHPLRWPLCIALSVLAGLIFFAAIRQLIRHKTHPSPYKPTAALVVRGIYRFTRNPIYIAFLLIVLAFAVGANDTWLLLSPLLLFILLQFGVVKREERYLSIKFGNIYDDYRRRVRRWI